MKKLFPFIAALLSFSNSSFAQIVLPDYEDVCPGQEIEYTIQSDYYGNDQIFTVANGVFIAPSGSYIFRGDSTCIIMNVSSSNKKFTIRWKGNTTNLGRIILNSAQTQDFNIAIVPDPAGSGLADKNIFVGTHSFDVLLFSISEVTYNEQRSNNISLTNYDEDTEFGVRNYTYSYSITGDQPGWIAYRTYNPKGIECGISHSEWDTVHIYRKLNPPTISFSGYLMCNAEQKTVSVSSDPNAQDYTWTVSSGLKISVGQNYNSTYTTSNTSVTIKAQTTTPGAETISIKSNGSGSYVDSDTHSKEIWHGVPNPDKIIYYNVGPYYPDLEEICLDNPNDGKALFDHQHADVQEYEWDALDWTITQHPNDPFPLVDMQDVLITAPMYGYSTGDPVYFSIRGKNRCGWGEWKYPKLELEAVNCGLFMMTVSPNPADTYVNISFSDLDLSAEKQTSELSSNRNISLKKVKETKNGVIDEYLVQILDKNGVIRKLVQTKTLNLNIDTRDLEPDTYFLHVTWNGELIKQQLIIH
jgi:hypothetical protein